MSKRGKVKVTVHSLDIFGSALKDGKYQPDSLLDFRKALDGWIEKIPAKLLDSARLQIESIGGYEGEHHAEIEVFYHRPETDGEMAARVSEETERRRQTEAQERAAYDRLKAKFG